ncbi:MAG: hypothetical protein OXC15_05390 [Rhodospirillaceae bacterium]|nr:hypothetical protein [Rhodospirillaceae bacterium]
MFEAPTFEFWSTFYTAVGVSVLWGRMGYKKVRVFALSRLTEQLNLPQRANVIIQFCVFLALGVVVADAVVKPASATQALAAGLGWTALLAQPSSG